jgi:hypothetical protein
MSSMKDQQIQEKQNISSFKAERMRQIIVNYLDITIRSLIAFFVFGILLYIILVGVFHANFIFVLIMSFVISIMFSPILSRIKLGDRVFSAYERWLEKTFKLDCGKN